MLLNIDEIRAKVATRKRACRAMNVTGSDGSILATVIVERPTLAAFECWLDGGKGNTATKQLVLDSLVHPTQAEMLRLAEEVPGIFAGVVGAETIGLINDAGKVEVLKL